MKSEVFEAIASRIAEAPRLSGATKNEQQAAFRARVAGLKLVSQASAMLEYDEQALVDAFRENGIQIARGETELSLVADGDGLEIRRNVIAALRTYIRPHREAQRREAIRAYNAARPSKAKFRAERRAQLAAMGIDLARFREVCDVIDSTPSQRQRQRRGPVID
ncbi:hypothetical protein [Burkholderia sp. Bp9142]|uniref:hypothetical protein n=1 Tax=Burkholderia sp. Bp9142 TaxID=2184573 RepID=UPI000F5AC977|nr:hypothetical protein [Burkholderia sp. Bp9142]RQR34826.1 hypothetical protein DIE22_16185 [Burkholderia sp. Bp9142]